MLMKMFLITIVLLTSILSISCTTLREYRHSQSESELSCSIDSVYNEIGLKVQKKDNHLEVNGPMNKYFKIYFEKVNNDSILLKYETIISGGKYLNNMHSILSYELSGKPRIPKAEKSKAKFTLLNAISPGIGWYYITDNSIYTSKNNLIPSLLIGGWDAYLIYKDISEERSIRSIIDSAIFFRVLLLFPGFSFINYDNKVIRAGFNINF